jgi:hypothetical protein
VHGLKDLVGESLATARAVVYLSIGLSTVAQRVYQESPGGGPAAGRYLLGARRSQAARENFGTRRYIRRVRCRRRGSFGRTRPGTRGRGCRLRRSRSRRGRTRSDARRIQTNRREGFPVDYSTSSTAGTALAARLPGRWPHTAHSEPRTRAEYRKRTRRIRCRCDIRWTPATKPGRNPSPRTRHSIVPETASTVTAAMVLTLVHFDPSCRPLPKTVGFPDCSPNGDRARLPSLDPAGRDKLVSRASQPT